MKLVALGGLELSGTAFNRPKPLLLVAYVALEGARDRRHLAELFWPEATDSLNSLSAALKQIRLGAPGLVESDSKQVWTQVPCDAKNFLEATESGQHEKALELYSGPFLNSVYLSGWSTELEEWVYSTRELLAGRVRHAWLLVAEERAASGNYAEATQYAEKAYLLPGAAQAEPEELARMHTLLAAGNSSYISRLRKDAEGFGVMFSLSTVEAQTQLPPSLSSSVQGIAKQRLPIRGTSFIGRDVEVVEAANHLARPDCSLLTLTGAGGVGKSRLAVRVAMNLSQHFADSVYFIPLETLGNTNLIPSSIIGILGLSLQGSEDSLVQLTRHIGDKAMLLVLDNYEHLLEGVTIVGQLLHACPNLKLLITSREQLNIEPEWVLPLTGFTVPSETVSLPDSAYYDVLRLFEDRAKRARFSFKLTLQELPWVISICRQVEGIPLGIELGAAWVKMLSCQEIAQEIEQTTDFLTSTRRDVPERHRSIRAVFEHSWRLLTSQEQVVLRKLSVFQGGFKREAAAEVAGATIPVLASLVDKSLVRVTAGGRYDYHPLIHRYAREKLVELPDEWVKTREQHGLYYVHFLEVRGTELVGMRQHEGLSAMVEELANIRAVWNWAVEEKRVYELQRSAGPLASFYEFSGQFQEGAASFGAAVSALEGTIHEHGEALSHILLCYSTHTYRLSFFSQAMQEAKRALELAKASCNDDLIARSLDLLGQIAWQVGEFSTSIQYLKEALVLAEVRNDSVLIASLTRSIGWVENKKGDYPEAKKRLHESLSLFQQLEMPHEIVNNLNALGHFYINSGRPNEAQPFFEDGLKLARETEAQVMVPHLLSGAGLALYELGNYSEARAVLERSLRENANELAQAWVLVVLSRVATATADFDLAQDYIDQALKMSWTVRQLPEVLDALVALSELCIKQQRIAQAARTLQVVSAHSATTGYSRAVAQSLLKGLHDSSTSTPVDEHIKCSQQTLLEEIVGKILN